MRQRVPLVLSMPPAQRAATSIHPLLRAFAERCRAVEPLTALLAASAVENAFGDAFELLHAASALNIDSRATLGKAIHLLAGEVSSV